MKGRTKRKTGNNETIMASKQGFNCLMRGWKPKHFTKITGLYHQMGTV